MSTTPRTVIRTFADLNQGDTVIFGLGTEYVVESLSSVIDGIRSVVFSDTNDGRPYTYAADESVEVVIPALDHVGDVRRDDTLIYTDIQEDLTMTYDNRSTDDFRPGDIVRTTSNKMYHHSARSHGLEPHSDYVVLQTHPHEHHSRAHEVSRGRPNTVGDVTVIDPQSFEIYQVGINLVDPPARDDDSVAVIAGLERELAQSRAHEDACAAERDRVRGLLDHHHATADEQVAQLRSEVEQAQAATALEAHRANKAERRANRLQHAVDYANRFLPNDQHGRVQGYLDGLRRAAADESD